MPKFSQSSFSKLCTCHHDLQVLFYEVIKWYDCEILAGHRTEEEQTIEFDRGNTRFEWPNSKHNYQPAMAVDVAPVPVRWKSEKRFYVFAGYVMGIAQRLKEEGKMTHSVRFGGEPEDDQSRNALVHFELFE